MNVPNVQPPLPSDWQIRPTYPVLPPVQYQVAHHWENGVRERVEAQHHRNSTLQAAGAHIQRALRAAAKRIPALPSWVRGVEEPVRRFLVEHGQAVVDPLTSAQDVGASSDETDSEDEEIVFVGRNGATRDGKPWKPARRQVAGQQEQERGMVLEEMDDAAGGAFKLVHLLPYVFFRLFIPLWFSLFPSVLIHPPTS